LGRRVVPTGRRRKGLIETYRSRLKWHLAVLAGITGLALVAAACSSADSGSAPTSRAATASDSGAAGAPAELTVELDWVPNPDHVGLYYAQDKGYFADDNLTVEFRAPSNASDPIKLVGLGEVDLAISYQPEMFYGQQNELHVMAVATVVPVPLNSMIISPDTTVTTLPEISGKSVGVTGIPSDDSFYTTMLKTAGLTEGDVTKVNVGFSLVPSLLSNKVDAIIGGYRNVEAIQVEQETGRKPTVFPANELGVPTYAELVVVANADRLTSDPAYADAVTRFVATLVKGTDAAIADPVGATAVTKGVTQYDPKFLDESVPYTLALLKPAAGTKTGCIDAAAWQTFGDWMKTNELITSTPDAAAISTDQYMPYSCS
jgi:putative hydroxymethylpyrimidine transport system substrate-binding protein